MLRRSTEARPSIAGFTLIEALIALSIVAVVLAPIGALIASTARGARWIEAHLTRLAIARLIFTAIPDRDQLVSDRLSGEIASHAWRLEASPFESANTGSRIRTPWVPVKIVVTIRSPVGETMQLSTVRLQRRSGG
jgi:general secretion pathway protein I